MGRPRKYNRDEVLLKATDLFWTKGYEGTHLRELVEVTGINRFSLYKEFGGKEGLFQEALSNYIDGLKVFAEIYQREPLGLQNIRDSLLGLIDFGFTHGCFAINVVREKFVVPEPAYEAVSQLVQGTEAFIRMNLEAAQASGELDPDVDIVGQAKLLTSIDMGILNYGIVSSDPEDARRMVKAVEYLWN